MAAGISASSPLVTANWEADSDNTWTVPIGGGVGRVFTIGKQPINVSVQSFHNVVSPDDIAPDASVRLTVRFLFPKSRG